MNYTVTGANGTTGADGTSIDDFGKPGGGGEDAILQLTGPLTSVTNILVIGGNGGVAGKEYDGGYNPINKPGDGGSATIIIGDVTLASNSLSSTNLIAIAEGGSTAPNYASMYTGASGDTSIIVNGLTSITSRTLSIGFSALTPGTGFGQLGNASVVVDNINISNVSALQVSLDSFVGTQIGLSSFSSKVSLTNSVFRGTTANDVFDIYLNGSYGFSSNFQGLADVSFGNNTFAMGDGNDALNISLISTAVASSPNKLTGNVFDGGDGIDVISISSKTYIIFGNDDGRNLNIGNNTFRNFEFLDLNGNISYIGALKNYMYLPSLSGRTISYDLSVDGLYHQVVGSSNAAIITTGAAGSSIRLTSGTATINGGSGTDYITFGSGQAVATGGDGGRNTFIFDKNNMHQSTTGDDGLTVITDFHRDLFGWSSTNDFIYMKNFSSNSYIDYVREVVGSPDKHVYAIHDGAYQAEFILQYTDPNNGISSNQYHFL